MEPLSQARLDVSTRLRAAITAAKRAEVSEAEIAGGDVLGGWASHGILLLRHGILQQLCDSGVQLDIP